MVRIDPYDNKGRYFKWKEKMDSVISDLTEKNRELSKKQFPELVKNKEMQNNKF